MEKVKRFIDVIIPMEACTLRCHYCYITQHGLFNNKPVELKYSPDVIKKAMTKERLGGICFINLCGGGETLLQPKVVDYMRALLENGHFVSVVTNATLTKRFEEIAQFPSEYMERLFFKFSYHYLELKKHNIMDKFFDNIRLMRDKGASFTLEATPSDELIPYIDEMKKVAIDNVGAIPHITVARDETKKGNLPILTNMSREDYHKTWGVFNSSFFEYKYSIFGVKRKEFCYAGDWVCWLDMGSGVLHQCYKSLYDQNIFDDPGKPIKWKAIGNNCCQYHCYNGHGFICWGGIPELESPTYAEIRNRVCNDGTEWLKPRMKAFMSTKASESNTEYSESKKIRTNLEMRARKLVKVASTDCHRLISKVKRTLK